MKYTFIFFIIFLFSSCNNTHTETKGYSKDVYKKLAANPNFHEKINQKVELKLVDTLHIITRDKPISYLANDIYKDSLFFGLRNPFGGQDNNKIDVYNLKTGSFVKTINIEAYKIKRAINNISVHSLDTIFITQFFPPNIKIINFNGDILKSIDLGKINLIIDNKDAPVEDNYYVTMMHNKPKLMNNRIYFLINPMGSADMPGFRRAQKLGIYDLKKDKIIGGFCPPKGVMALKGVFFLNQLMQPYFLLVRDKIYINYPLDHYVYIYDLDGQYLEKKLVSASAFEVLPEPAPYKKIMDHEYMRDWWLPIPFYGPLNYHPKQKLFTRIFHQKQALKTTDGKLNNGGKRKSYVVIYDENFNKLGETFFDNGQLGVYKALPLSNGYLIAPNEEHWKNENEFVEKYVYEFKKN